MGEDSLNSNIYNKNAIEFITVATEVCLFLEQSSNYDKKTFLEHSLKFLPLLYLKSLMLEKPEQLLDEDLECFVTESDYEIIRADIALLLGYSDRYLEVFREDIQLSEEGIASDISENLSDIYQELKDFLLRYQIGNEEVMNDALFICKTSFEDRWGQILVNCLRALHHAFFNESEDDLDEASDAEQIANARYNFLHHQQKDSSDSLLNSDFIIE